jgi:glycosyltransferase involved in cell wall biosynthesis
MRIALVAQSRAPWTPHYASAFQAEGHRVTVYSFSAGEIPGVPTEILTPDRTDGESGKASFLLKAPALRRRLRAFGPDVVLATYLLSDGLAAALAWRGPLVVSARGGDVLAQKGNFAAPEWIHKGLVRFVCGRARRVHAVSEEIRDRLAEWGIAGDRLACFPMGVDVARFHPAPLEEGPPRTLRLVCTRRHEPVYDNHVIVTALARLKARLPQLRATFVGGGPLLGARRTQAERAGLDGRVMFLEQVDHARLPDLLREHDLYVSASSSDGTSSSLLEAMACGLVPIVSRIAGNLPWVEDGQNGFLFEVGDAEGLANAIERAVGDAHARSRARTANPSIVAQRGNQEINNRSMLGLLEEAVRS